MEIHFTIPGKPQGKARPRVRRDGHAYTPSQTTQYEELVRWCWRRSGAVKLNGAIRALILARYPVPKRDSRKTQDAKICGEIPCTIKPDCDNIAKIVLDALNGLAYDDDSQVTELEVHKLYGDIGDVFVRLECLVDVIEEIKKLPIADAVPGALFRELRDELCLHCGKYTERHLGACDGCKWRGDSE